MSTRVGGILGAVPFCVRSVRIFFLFLLLSPDGRPGSPNGGGLTRLPLAIFGCFSVCLLNVCLSISAILTFNSFKNLDLEISFQSSSAQRRRILRPLFLFVWEFSELGPSLDHMHHARSKTASTLFRVSALDAYLSLSALSMRASGPSISHFFLFFTLSFSSCA